MRVLHLPAEVALVVSVEAVAPQLPDLGTTANREVVSCHHLHWRQTTLPGSSCQ